MLQYSEITEKKYIVFKDEPYEVLSSHVFRKQQRKPVNATKLRNMITGKTTDHSFHFSDKVEEAEIEKREIKYLYKNNKDELWFSEPNDPSKRFQLSKELVGNLSQFMKENEVVESLSFNDEVVGITLPIKVELKVVEAHPAVKGNTAQGATKAVVLETGAEIQVPMFIKEGDTVRINTTTGEYTDRVS